MTVAEPIPPPARAAATAGIDPMGVRSADTLTASGMGVSGLV
jgi:hypothetical protein